jgi:eukaryotic-like serine/threonine-protein kinase
MDTLAQSLFVQALELPAAERDAFFDQACGGDAELRLEVQRLLVDAARADSFFGNDGQLTIGAGEFGNTHSEKPGDIIGPYKLREQIGEGGFGSVWVADQEKPVRRRVAIKLVKAGMDTKQVIARFEQERQALAMMDHPNISKVFDAGATERGRPYFVMELVRGVSITEYCDQNRLPTPQRLALFITICQAVQHAHQKGIIHRDIKPSNILVTLHDGEPVPKVIDFGIAKATEGRLTDATIYTQLQQFVGTPAYMSPEQAEMSGLDIDTRSDIYSLGVLLYELLTGKTPFDAKELMSRGVDGMRKTIREEEPARPSTKLGTLKDEDLKTAARHRSVEAARLLHQLRGDLDWIVMKCLEKDRTRRYETSNGLAADLQRHLKNEPVVARPPSASYRLQKTFRRNKLAFSAATAVALSLIIGTAVSTSQTFAARSAQRETEIARASEQQQRLEAEKREGEAEAERQRADAQARKATETEEQSRRLLYASDMNLAQQSLKQNNLGRARRLLERHRPVPGEEDLRGWEWRHLWQQTRSGALVTLTNRPVRGFDVSFSPDGSRLAIGWFDGLVELWDVPGRKLIRPLNLTGPAAQVAFSPVHNLLAATSEPGTVTLYDLETHRDLLVWQPLGSGAWQIRDLSFSKDGSKLVVYAVATADQVAEISVVNVSAGSTESRWQSVFSGAGTVPFPGAGCLSPDHLRLYVGRVEDRGYSIQCLDAATGAEIWQTAVFENSLLMALAVSPDGRVLVSGAGYADPTLRVWDADTGRLVRQVDGHTAWIGKLAFSTDGRQLVSSSTDQTIQFWDTSTWTVTKVLRGHTDEVHGVAVSETAELVASASKNGDIMLWKLGDEQATGEYSPLQEKSLTKDQVLPLDGSRVLLLPEGKPAELIDLRSDAPHHLLSEMGDSDNILCMFGSNHLCYWNGVNQVLIGELRGKEFIQRGALTVDSGRPGGVICLGAKQLLAWNEPSSPNSVFVASYTSPGRRVEFMGDVGGLLPGLFSEDGNYLMAWSPVNGAVRAWNVETGQIVASIDKQISFAAFGAGGRVLVLLHSDLTAHEVIFYDLARPHQPPRSIVGRHTSANLAVSPDGKLVASSDQGGAVRLYDPDKGELIATLHGHLNSALGLAFSPDGRRLISTSNGREAVKLWDVETRQELLTLSGQGMLTAAHWTADGSAVLAGSPWHVWRAPSWEQIAAIEAVESHE